MLGDYLSLETLEDQCFAYHYLVKRGFEPLDVIDLVNRGGEGLTVYAPKDMMGEWPYQLKTMIERFTGQSCADFYFIVNDDLDMAADDAAAYLPDEKRFQPYIIMPLDAFTEHQMDNGVVVDQALRYSAVGHEIGHILLWDAFIRHEQHYQLQKKGLPSEMGWRDIEDIIASPYLEKMHVDEDGKSRLARIHDRRVEIFCDFMGAITEDVTASIAFFDAQASSYREDQEIQELIEEAGLGPVLMLRMMALALTEYLNFDSQGELFFFDAEQQVQQGNLPPLQNAKATSELADALLDGIFFIHNQNVMIFWNALAIRNRQKKESGIVCFSGLPYRNHSECTQSHQCAGILCSMFRHWMNSKKVSSLINYGILHRM